MASYKLPLKSLSFGVQEFKYVLNASFFNEIEECEVSAATIEALVVIDRKSDDIFQCDFSFKGTITIPCDRCLDDMNMPVNVRYHLSVKVSDRWDDSRDNVLVIPDTQRELDIAPLMRDTVLLAIPIQHTHAEGECNQEMLDRLNLLSATEIADDKEMQESEETKEENYRLGDNPRWDALKKLIDNN